MKETTATTPDKTGAACMQNHNNEQPSDYTTCKDINIPKNADSKTTANRSGLESPKRPQTTSIPATSRRSTQLRNTLDPTRALPSVQMEDGNEAADSQQEMERWEAYFAELLIGELL